MFNDENTALQYITTNPKVSCDNTQKNPESTKAAEKYASEYANG